MFSFAPEAEVYLYCEAVDFRKQIDGLAVLVAASMQLDPMRPALFCFTNRRADRVRVLWWDRNGFCLWTKRLEKDRFAWPTRAGDEVIVLDGQRLSWLLDGFDIFRHPPHQQLSYGALTGTTG